ncbi:MAG: spinster family MFS transporter [Sphingobium sp.]
MTERQAEPETGAATKAAEPNGALSAGQRRYLLAFLVLIYAINFIDRTIINVLVQPIKTDLGLTDTQIGLVSGVAFGILYGVMGLPFARIAERRSRRNLISLALGVWSVMTAACGLAHNFWHLFAARVGVGIGEAGCTPAAQSMLSDAFPKEKRASALSTYSMGVPIGTLLGAMFGGWIGQEFGWRMAFVVVGLPGVAIAVLARLTLREPPRGGTEGPAGEVPGLIAALTILWREAAFRNIVIAFTLTGTAGYSISLFLVAYLQRHLGVALIDASLAFGLISGTTGIVGMFIGGLLTDRLARKDIRALCWVPAGALALAAPLMMIGLVQNNAMAMAAFLIPAAILYPMYMGPGFAASHSLVEPTMRATASAVLLMISTVIGMGLGPATTGAISDIATRSLFDGDFDQLCRVAEAMAPGCADAEARGLMVALVSAAAFYAGGALFMLLAGRRMKR